MNGSTIADEGPATSPGPGSTPQSHWTDLLRSMFAGRPVIVAMDILVGAAGLASVLDDLGVEQVLLVTRVRGVGDVAEELENAALVLGNDLDDDATVMEGIRAWQATLDEPPQVVLDRVDAFDPDGRALVVSAAYHVGQEWLGRPILGARRSPWLALEDKTTVDALWDHVDVARAPSRIVDLADDTAVATAAADLDAGNGTCWVADNTTGWHGGGEYLRWSGPGGDATTAVEELRATGSRRARVMPFLEGRPCSIHGWVFDDHVAALRPCEMVVLRDDDHRFVYGGGSSVWEPPSADREQMRAVARRVGRHLREGVDYRGTFTVDGVLTADGFLPTELNPRFGGALMRVAAGVDLPIHLLHLVSISRPDLDWRPEELEELVLTGADANPVARTIHELPTGATHGTWHLEASADWNTFTVTDFAVAESEASEAEPQDSDEGSEADQPTADVTVRVGPSAHGGEVAIVNLAGLPRGWSAAAPAVAVLETIAPDLGVDLDRLHAAPDVRA